MANAVSILVGTKLAADLVQKSCTIEVTPVAGGNEAEVTLKFKINQSQVKVGTIDQLKNEPFARALFVDDSANLAPAANDIRSSFTTEGEKIFLNVSVQLSGVKGKHAS